MSLEELDNLETPPVSAVDDFEAALAASTEAPVVDVAVVPDQVEAEEENDENAEFRRALRTALGD